jgi:hypothetical protein
MKYPNTLIAAICLHAFPVIGLYVFDSNNATQDNAAAISNRMALKASGSTAIRPIFITGVLIPQITIMIRRTISACFRF